MPTDIGARMAPFDADRMSVKATAYEGHPSMTGSSHDRGKALQAAGFVARSITRAVVLAPAPEGA
jgi:hypothetical protein